MKNQKRTYKRQVQKLLSGLLVAFAIAFVAFPLCWMMLSSFKPGTELFKIPASVFPKDWSLVWYQEAFSSNEVVRYFLNSLIVSSSTMIINAILGTMGAYSLARFKYSGRNLVLAGILSAYCVPPIMLMVPLYRIVSNMGLTSTYAGIIIGHVTTTLPFAIWQMIPFFKKVPTSLEEAAKVDGASDLRVFTTIVFPLCKVGILSSGIMSFILSWNEYLLSSVMISRDTMKTLTVGLSNFISSTEIEWGVIMALGTVTTIPIVLLFAAIQKYFVEGLTAGAVKG